MKINVPDLFAQTIQSMLYCSNERELFHLLSTAVKSLEFDYYAYGVRITSPVTKPTFLLKNNYTYKWQSRYADNNYIAIDPTVKHGLYSTHPITWDDKLIQEQPEFWEEATSHGLKYGWRNLL